ncbi:MAG: single-stranded DNA-binding protein, partial [Marinovum sp.]|nr:single-stranded DNA-binding protein [Marinovum sp.]
SGNDRYSTEVVLQGFGSTLTMLDGRGDSGGGGGGAPGGYDGGYSAPEPAQESSSLPSRDLDDEIPF